MNRRRTTTTNKTVEDIHNKNDTNEAYVAHFQDISDSTIKYQCQILASCFLSHIFFHFFSFFSIRFSFPLLAIFSVTNKTVLFHIFNVSFIKVRFFKTLLFMDNICQICFHLFTFVYQIVSFIIILKRKQKTKKLCHFLFQCQFGVVYFAILQYCNIFHYFHKPLTIPRYLSHFSI